MSNQKRNPVWIKDSTRIYRGRRCDIRLTPTNAIFIYNRTTGACKSVRLSAGVLVGSPRLTNELDADEANILVAMLKRQMIHRARAADDAWEFDWTN